MKHEYWANDDVTFRGEFAVDGVAQKPSSATIKVMEVDSSTPYIDEVAAIVSGTEISYKVADFAVGAYRAFITAVLGSGADQRTGIIDCIVRSKEAG